MPADGLYIELSPESLASTQGASELNRMLRVLFDAIAGDTVGRRVFKGFGTPEGQVAANVGSIFMREDGAANETLYMKESGAAATGWIAITSDTLDYKVKASLGDATPGFLDAKVKRSIEVDSDDLQLVGDEAAPGNDKYYGTDGSGNKGYHAAEIPTEQDMWKIAIVASLIFEETIGVA